MVIVKVSYSGGCLGKNIGCEKAPNLLADGGKDLDVDNGNVDLTMKNLENADGDIFIGGDHSISYGIFKGFSKKLKNPGLVVFDAHSDCYPEEFVNHENWIYHLITERVLKKENLMIIGLRALDNKERIFLNEYRIRHFTMDQLFNNEEDVCDSIMESALLFDGAYLSIDIDVLDPAFAPGTGYTEPGGMSTVQLFYFLRRLSNLRNLKIIDLVEINPDKDINGITVKTGLEIIKFFK